MTKLAWVLTVVLLTVFSLILNRLRTSGYSALGLVFSRSRLCLIYSARVNLLSSVEPKYRKQGEHGMNLLFK